MNLETFCLKKGVLDTAQTKQQVINSILDMAMAAGNKGIAFSPHEKHTNPFMASVTRPTPMQTQTQIEVYAQDFGIDMDFAEPGLELQKANLRRAIMFLATTLGIFTRIPANHPSAQLYDFFSEEEWETFLNQEKWFAIRLEKLGVS